jgi:hypothetical protein
MRCPPAQGQLLAGHPSVATFPCRQERCALHSVLLALVAALKPLDPLRMEANGRHGEVLAERGGFNRTGSINYSSKKG